MGCVPMSQQTKVMDHSSRLPGGIPGKFSKTAKRVEGLDVTWKWFDEQQGIVEWIFTNNTDKQVSFILFRNGYYFGDAYWPIYLNYPQYFNTGWLDSEPKPLEDKGVENNSAPMGLVDLGNSRYVTAFIFTLAPKQTWAMLEGGFMPGMFVPSGYFPVPVELVNIGEYCIGYNEAAVASWDVQTFTNMQGYSPNPKTFKVAVFKPSISDYPTTVSPFPPSVFTGKCNCQLWLDLALNNMSAGNYQAAASYIANYIVCLVQTSEDKATTINLLTILINMFDKWVETGLLELMNELFRIVTWEGKSVDEAIEKVRQKITDWARKSLGATSEEEVKDITDKLMELMKRLMSK